MYFDLLYVKLSAAKKNQLVWQKGSRKVGGYFGEKREVFSALMSLLMLLDANALSQLTFFAA